MIEAIGGFRLPRYAQIPDVGLYLEQVVRYVNTPLRRWEPELTKFNGEQLREVWG